MPHVSIAWNNLTEGHATVLSSVWNVRLALFCREHQVWVSGRHRQTCCNTCKNCIAVDILDVTLLALFYMSASYCWTIFCRFFVWFALMTFFCFFRLALLLASVHVDGTCCCFVNLKCGEVSSISFSGSVINVNINMLISLLTLMFFYQQHQNCKKKSSHFCLQWHNSYLGCYKMSNIFVKFM